MVPLGTKVCSKLLPHKLPKKQRDKACIDIKRYRMMTTEIPIILKKTVTYKSKIVGCRVSKGCRKITSYAAISLRPWLLFLLLEKSQKRDTGNLHNLKSNPGNISHSMPFPTKSSNQHLVLCKNKIH